MMLIFSEMIEDSIEVFMNDFSVVGFFFVCCLENLTEVLKICEDFSLVLNWKKCNFIMKEVIVLDYRF